MSVLSWSGSCKIILQLEVVRGEELNYFFRLDLVQEVADVQALYLVVGHGIYAGKARMEAVFTEGVWFLQKQGVMAVLMLD